MKLSFAELRDFLNEKAEQYNNPDFIGSDPIQIVHQFSLPQDMEIAGFLTATIAWGNRKSIITNAQKMMALMGDSPYDFVMSHSPEDLERFEGFVHRTFNATDLRQFITSLKHLYTTHGGLQPVFAAHHKEERLQHAITDLKLKFFESPHQARTRKHLSDPSKGSAAKRINMFLRWMARKDNKGVDLGIWDQVSPAQLSCPLDVHSGNVARKLGLLHRKQNDAKALEELDRNLRAMDPADPVKYDFALFGLGVFEKF